MWGSTGLFRMFSARSAARSPGSSRARSSCSPRASGSAGRRPRTDLRRAAYLVWGGWLARHGPRLLAHGRHLPRVLHGGPRPGHRRPRRHGCRRGVGAPRRARSARSPSPRRPPRPRRGASSSSRARPSRRLAAHRRARGRHGRGPRCFLVVTRMHRRAVPLVLGAALVAGLAGPAAYSVQTVSTGHTGSIVDAGPTVAGATGGPGGGMRGGAGSRRRDARSGSRRHDAGRRHRNRRPRRRGRHGRPARRRDPEHRGRLGAVGRRRPLHLGRRGHRLAERGRTADRHAAAGHGHRRLQRQRPVARRWPSSRSTCRPARSTTSSPAAGFGGQQNGGSTASSQISTWVQQNFATVTIGGSTFYDLTQPASGSSGTGTGTSTGTV